MSAGSWGIARPSWSSIPAPSPRRGPRVAGSPVRGAGGEWYILDVPCNTQVRDLERRRPPRRRAGVGRKPEVPFIRADEWAARQSASRWVRQVVRHGEKGPLEVEAMSGRVKAKQER